jgi:coproporphyrinogen III oxidase-like Fe-S oxidoreductase
MAKKKKIREEFDIYFKSGNEEKIKQMLAEYPWLLDEQTTIIDTTIGQQNEIVAALGVMEDELGGRGVPIDEIIFSLRVDFNIQKKENEVLKELNSVEILGYVKKDAEGWKLTSEGSRLCDNFLNSKLEINNNL